MTRALTAYVIQYRTGASTEECAKSVTDGSGDNGIDGIFYDDTNKKLCLVQSKWIHDGNSEPSNGDIKKFLGGIRDLLNLKFDRFNSKIISRKSFLTTILHDPNVRYEVIVAHTGSALLAEPSQLDISDFASEMNDVSPVVFVDVINQSKLHNSLIIGATGEPIDLKIELRSWGRKENPYEAFYGQLTGEQVADWWNKYQTRLFAKNLRSVLGDTEVNLEIRQTLEQQPSDFWYFNNGITILAKSVNKPLVGGSSTDFGIFHCEDISIVNGAQTVSTIGKYSEENSAALQDVLVHVRIIVRGEDESFGEKVTKTNNTQNRIENRDFVALDPEQTRIRTELAIDGIDYQIIRSETTQKTDVSFGLVEATTALACASNTIRLPVQLKREISRLWDDLSRAPYKELFNRSVTGIYIWRCVQIQRVIDKIIDQIGKEHEEFYPTATHGNRIVGALAFQQLSTKQLQNPSIKFDIASYEGIIANSVPHILSALHQALEENYPNSIIPTLFKNLQKCEHLAKIVQNEIQ